MFKKLMEKIMAKKKKEFLQEIAPIGEEEIDEIAKEVAEEEIEPFEVEADPDDYPVDWNPTLELPEDDEGKMDKQKFLDSIGLGERPGSQLAATKWKEYLGI